MSPFLLQTPPGDHFHSRNTIFVTLENFSDSGAKSEIFHGANAWINLYSLRF